MAKIEKDIDVNTLKDNYEKILILLSPAVPHFSAECFEDLKSNAIKKWPSVVSQFLNEDKIEYVIQINGKKRAILKENRDLDQESLLLKVKSNKLSEKYLKNKSILKVIFVKNRLINLLTNE